LFAEFEQPEDELRTFVRHREKVTLRNREHLGARIRIGDEVRGRLILDQ
jgi:hypothetical protein